MNIPNAGQAVGLPPDVVVESICVIDGDGIRGRDRAALPPPYDEIVRRHVATQELTVEAAAAGRPHAGGGGLRPRPAGRPGRPARHGGHGRRAARRHGGVAAPLRLVRRPGPLEGHACASDSSGSAPWGCPWRATSSRPATTSPWPRAAGDRSTPPWRWARPTGARRGAWPRPPRSSSCASPTRPRWSRWSTPCCPCSVPGTTVVDCSTIDPEVERAQHARVSETGARYLDAPLSGGTARGARRGRSR